MASKLHHKNTFYKTLGLFAKKPIVSLVGLIGTDSLVPRAHMRKETQHGYEAKALSLYEPHPEVIQHFKRT